jgi:hypothetical protein
MSRADTIAVRNGGEALHVNTKKTRESGGLDLADLRETLGNMGHRAVMLAQLFPDR